MNTDITPFQIAIPESDLDDLRTRLEHTRWPESEVVDDWTQGIPLSYLKEVCDYWKTSYNWRTVEKRLNALPQYTTKIDGLDVYFIHIRSSNEDARPLLLTHGWPGSVIEFLKVIGPLTEPDQHSASDAESFHLVIPALPGFGFSGKPSKTGWSVDKIARAWSELMLRLGYTKYLAQGGDWGAAITASIGAQDPEHCIGLHTNMPVVAPSGELLENLTTLEEDALRARQFYQDWDSGYSKQQSTRPQTLGYSLVDSAAGQAAWILEKFYQWTDCNGHPENVLSRDELLDNVMLYWLTASGASSARIYWESFASGSSDNVNVPSGCSIFPKEIFKASQRWVETRFKDLRYFNVLDTGGHFAAFEQPELYVQELRACFQKMS